MDTCLYRQTNSFMHQECGDRCSVSGQGGRGAVITSCRLGFRAFDAAAVAIAVLLTTHWADAQDLKRGQELLARDCSSCHAIGRTGESPHRLAPPFRTLGKRYPIESLEEALGEGIMSGHPDMPEFSFEADEVGAIIAYLKSIQQR